MSVSEFARLQEGVPTRGRPGRESFPTQAKAVKLWIEALPLANSGATARLLYNGLKELNSLEVEPLSRLEILELLRQPVSFVVSGMDKHVIGQPLPLPQQKKQIGTVLRDFQRELELGYRQVIVDLCQPKGTVPFLRGRHVAQAVARGLFHVGQLLQKAYLTYGEIPPGAWRDLHALMAYAVSQGLHDKSVSDPQLKGFTLTPQALYLQALLLFITNPYRLTQKEIAEVEQATLVWSPYCELRFDGKGEGVFTIDPSLDQAPGVRQEEERPWRLETAGLVRMLMNLLTSGTGAHEQPIQPRSKIGTAPALSRELLQRLLLAWGFSGERKFQRLPAGHRMDAAIGLQAAHFLTGGNKDLNAFVQSLSGAVLLSDRERAAAWAQASSETSKPVLAPVKVLDQSLGGYRILWENAQNLRARVGELVVLGQTIDADDDDPRDWLVGVLRWLKCGNGDALEAGIQLLSRQAEAVVVRSLSAATSSKVIHRALLLKPLKLDGEGEPTLLVPAIVDEREDSELLRLPDPFGYQEYAVCAPLKSLRMIENTGSYKQLLFSDALEEIPDSALGNESGLRPNELDAIWSTV